MFTPDDNEIAPASQEEVDAIEAENTANPLMKVFVVKNPGWSSSMVLETIEAVLENIRAELNEMWTGDGLEFAISMEEMTRKEFDALDEFLG